MDRLGRVFVHAAATTVPDGKRYATTIVERHLEDLSQDTINQLANETIRRAGPVQKTIEPPASVRARAKAAQVNHCNDFGGYTYLNGGRRWPARGYTYRVNRASFGYNDNYRYLIGWAKWYWAHTYHDCTTPPSYSSTPRFTFAEGAETFVQGFSQDAVNVIAMNPNTSAQCGAVALQCVRNWGDAWGGAMYESDTLVTPEGHQFPDGQIVHWADVFNTAAGWPSVNYDFNGVMTHEVGHTLSIGHYGGTWQTMHPQAGCFPPGPYCGSFARTLAGGDINALYVLYPW